jgi:molecular chaperone DnaK
MTAAASPTMGIDFGTCRSSAAVRIGSEPHPVALGSGQARDMPTAIYVESDGKIVVGEEAASARLRDSTRYRDRFKLDIASARDIALPVGHAIRTYSWVDLVAAVLRRCRVRAETQLNNTATLTDVTLTVPTLYVEGGPEWRVMQAAAQAAGFSHVRIARESHAAAIYYDHLLRRAGVELDPEGKITLVYDLGGGTFDPTLIRRRAHAYELVGAGAYDGGVKCGGILFDEQIRRDFADKCPMAWQRLRASGDSAAVSDEGIAWRRAKDAHDLESFLITVKHRFASPDLGEVNEREPITGHNYRLTRAEFYSLIEPLLDRTIDSCRELVQRASVVWRDIGRIIMVGGSCHIPLVRDKLEALVREAGAKVEICWQRIGQTDRVVDPHLAVSLGAALVRERPAAEPARSVRRDIVPATLPDTPANHPARPPDPPRPTTPPRPRPMISRPRPTTPPPDLRPTPPPRPRPMISRPRSTAAEPLVPVPTDDTKRCRACGAVIDRRAEMCPVCKASQVAGSASLPGSLVHAPPGAFARSTKDKTTAGLLALMLGGIGAHKFYLGQTGAGVLYLVFCWTFLPALIGFVEAILLLTMSEQAFAQRHP